MNQRSAQKYILSFADAAEGRPYGKQLLVFSVKGHDFAIIEDKKSPLRLSLRCDPQLASVLRDRYEEVMQGYKLNKDKWITIVIAGQLSDSEIEDLIRLSYDLASSES